MNKITKQLKEQISKLDSIEERLEILKDKYAGKTAVILATGPSLNDYDHKEMRDMFSERDDLVIMPMKQAYEVSQGTSDFHIQNLWSMDRKTPTKYENETITFFNVAKSFQDVHLGMISDNNHPCDIWVPCLNPPHVTDKDTIQATGNFDLFWMLSNETQTMWGKTLLYSSAIPMALHIGCRSIVTMGWDLGTGVHFYPDNSSWSAIANKPDVKYTNEAVDTTPQLYDWCKTNNINFRILSDISPADDRFERLKSIQDI